MAAGSAGCTKHIRYDVSLADVITPSKVSSADGRPAGTLFIAPLDVNFQKENAALEIEEQKSIYHIWMDGGGTSLGLSKSFAREARSRKLFERVIDGSEYCHPADMVDLGVMLRPEAREALIEKVVAGTEAERIGLRADDEITFMDNVEVKYRKYVRESTEKMEPGSSHTIEWIRKGEPFKKTFKARLERVSECSFPEQVTSSASYILRVGNLNWEWQGDGDEILCRASFTWELSNGGPEPGSIEKGIAHASDSFKRYNVFGSVLNMMSTVGMVSAKGIEEVMNQVKDAVISRERKKDETEISGVYKPQEIVLPKLSGKKRLVAAMDFEMIAEGTEDLGITLSDALRVSLLRTGLVMVVDRNNMESVMREQAFSTKTCVSQDCVMRIGKLLSVEGMITGKISKIERTWIISLQMTNVETGVIEKAATEKCPCSREELLTAIEVVTRKLLQD